MLGGFELLVKLLEFFAVWFVFFEFGVHLGVEAVDFCLGVGGEGGLRWERRGWFFEPAGESFNNDNNDADNYGDGEEDED